MVVCCDILRIDESMKIKTKTEIAYYLAAKWKMPPNSIMKTINPSILSLSSRPIKNPISLRPQKLSFLKALGASPGLPLLCMLIHKSVGSGYLQGYLHFNPAFIGS